MIFGGLRDAGVLGLNARNSEIIARWNPRAHYPRVDDKLLTKRLAEAAGIAVPRLVGVVEAFGDVTRLGDLLSGAADFALKPVKGAMGNGIVVVHARDGDAFVRGDGKRLRLGDLEHHVASILAGLYSLGGRVDRAMFEERLQTHPVLAAVSVGGVPDVRIIVFRGVPIMAMVRLPTTRSRGRSNLHQGAVAVGVDMRTGLTIGGVHHGRPVDRHPDTLRAVCGIEIPHWQALLTIAARCADAFELGYIGVDLVLDAVRGPVLLEANARPGLSIQLANGRGLWPGIRAVQRLAVDGLSPERRAEVGREL